MSFFITFENFEPSDFDNSTTFGAAMRSAFKKAVANLSSVTEEDVSILKVTSGSRRAGVTIQTSVDCSAEAAASLPSQMMDSSDSGFSATFVAEAESEGLTVAQPTITHYHTVEATSTTSDPTDDGGEGANTLLIVTIVVSIVMCCCCIIGIVVCRRLYRHYTDQKRQPRQQTASPASQPRQQTEASEFSSIASPAGTWGQLLGSTTPDEPPPQMDHVIDLEMTTQKADANAPDDRFVLPTMGGGGVEDHVIDLETTDRAGGLQQKSDAAPDVGDGDYVMQLDLLATEGSPQNQRLLALQKKQREAAAAKAKKKEKKEKKKGDKSVSSAEVFAAATRAGIDLTDREVLTVFTQAYCLTQKHTPNTFSTDEVVEAAKRAKVDLSDGKALKAFTQAYCTWPKHTTPKHTTHEIKIRQDSESKTTNSEEVFVAAKRAGVDLTDCKALTAFTRAYCTSPKHAEQDCTASTVPYNQKKIAAQAEAAEEYDLDSMLDGLQDSQSVQDKTELQKALKELEELQREALICGHDSASDTHYNQTAFRSTALMLEELAEEGVPKYSSAVFDL